MVATTQPLAEMLVLEDQVDVSADFAGPDSPVTLCAWGVCGV